MNFRNLINEIIVAYRGLSTLGLTHIISTAMNSILWLIIASISTAETYGQIGFYFAIVMITGALANPGVNNTLLVYGNKDKKIISTLFALPIILLIVSSILLFFILTDFAPSLFLIGYSIFGLVITELIAKKLFQQFLKLTIIQKSLSLVLAPSLFHFIGLEGLFIGLAISYFVFIPQFIITLKKNSINFSYLKKYKKFLLHNYGLDINDLLRTQLDKILILPLFGSMILGNYYLAIQVLAIPLIVPGIIYQYLLIHETKEKSFHNLKLVTILFLILICVVVILLSPIIFPILFPEYEKIVELIQIMIIAIIPQTVNLMYLTKFITGGKSRIALNGSIIFIVSQILGIIILGNILEIFGLAIALILGNVLQLIYYFIKSKFSK